MTSLDAGIPAGKRRSAIPHRDRLLAAGGQLMAELGSFEFGVRDVVDRAQVSLRTFYEYFDTRDDFTLAIYSELNIQYAAEIRRRLPKGTPSARFRHFINAMVSPAYWKMGHPFSEHDAILRSRALAREGFRLAEAKPEGYRNAIAPYHELLAEVLGTDGTDVSIVLNSLLAEAHHVMTDVESDADAVAKHLFEYHRRAVGLPHAQLSARHKASKQATALT